MERWRHNDHIFFGVLLHQRPFTREGNFLVLYVSSSCKFVCLNCDNSSNETCTLNGNALKGFALVMEFAKMYLRNFSVNYNLSFTFPPDRPL